MEADTPPRRLLRPEEAATFLAISTRQLRDLTRAGSIRYVNIGQRDRETRRYTPEDLEAFIEERKCRSVSPLARARAASPFASEVIDFTVLAGSLPGEHRSNRASAKPKR